VHGLEVLELDDEVAVVQPEASKGASGEALDASNEALERVEKDAGPRDVMLIQPSMPRYGMNTRTRGTISFSAMGASGSMKWKPSSLMWTSARPGAVPARGNDLASARNDGRRGRGNAPMTSLVTTRSTVILIVLSGWT